MSVTAHPTRLSAVISQNGINRDRLKERGILLQKIYPDYDLLPHDLAVTSDGITRKGNIVTDLNYSGPEAYHG